MLQSEPPERGRPESTAQEPDTYSYKTLKSDTSLRLLTLQGAEGRNLIICELNEVDPQKIEDDNAKRKANVAANSSADGSANGRMNGSAKGGLVRQMPEGPSDLPVQFGGTPEQPLDDPVSQQNSLTSLEPTPTYEALSWCWGDDAEEPKVEIRIREKNEAGEWRSYPMKIPWTLAEALYSLRYPGKDRNLWVDAICINQEDVDERNRQVQMMAEIYGGATQVCVWLGTATKESARALNFIRDNVIKLWKFDELCAKQESSKDWKVFLDLMNRAWFSRRWVVQEIALAREAKVYCGSDNIDWQDFADAVSLFVEVESATHRLSEIMRRDEQFHHVPDFFGYVSALGATVLVEAVNTLFRESMDGDKRRREPLLGIEYLVSKMTVFDVTEPRDAIYALLAIAKDTAPRAASQQNADDKKPGARQIQQWAKNTTARPYRVNYEQPVVDICQTFTIFCIRQAAQVDPTSALDIICRPWAPAKLKRDGDTSSASSEAGGTVDDDALPSWIPSSNSSAYGFFSQAGGEKMGRKNADPLVGLPGLGQKNYSAAGTKTIDRFALRFKKRERSYSMYVSGFRLDEIMKKEVGSQGGNIPVQWLDAANWKNTELYPPQDFWKTLVADRGPHGRNPPAFYPRACRESVNKGGKESGIINTEALIDHGRCSIVAEFLRRVQAVIWRRSLMRTQNKKLGLVHEDAEEGDLICILYGCTVPVVLRRVKKSPKEIKAEIEADQEEYNAKITEAVTKIQKKVRERKRMREKRKLPRKYIKTGKKVILASLILLFILLLLQNTIGDRTVRDVLADLRIPLVPVAIAAVISLTPETIFCRYYYRAHRLFQSNKVINARKLNERHVYYRLLGECYVHGMMNGEAIHYQNEKGIKQEIFEIR